VNVSPFDTNVTCLTDIGHSLQRYIFDSAKINLNIKSINNFMSIIRLNLLYPLMFTRHIHH